MLYFCSLAQFVNHWHSSLICSTLQERRMRIRKQYTDKVWKSRQTDLSCNKSMPARVNYRINNNYCCYAYVTISSHTNNGYLYVNYLCTNNCYSNMKLIFKKSKYQNTCIIILYAQSIHYG